MCYRGNTASDWETQFIDQALDGYQGLSNVYVSNSKSYTLENDKTRFKDLPLVIGGICLIFVYVFLMTGTFSLVGHRFVLRLTFFRDISNLNGTNTSGLGSDLFRGHTSCKRYLVKYFQNFYCSSPSHLEAPKRNKFASYHCPLPR